MRVTVEDFRKMFDGAEGLKRATLELEFSRGKGRRVVFEKKRGEFKVTENETLVTIPLSKLRSPAHET